MRAALRDELYDEGTCRAVSQAVFSQCVIVYIGSLAQARSDSLAPSLNSLADRLVERRERRLA